MHQSHSRQRSKMLARLVAVAVAHAALIGCSVILSPPEHLGMGKGKILNEVLSSLFDPDLQIGDPQWKVGNESEIPGRLSIVEFIPPDEEIENWTRMFTIFNVPRATLVADSAKALAEELERKMRARCPEVQWELLESDQGTATYEWHIRDCPENPDQHELARILFGRREVWRLSYTEKTAELSDQTRAEWLEALSVPVIYTP